MYVFIIVLGIYYKIYVNFLCIQTNAIMYTYFCNLPTVINKLFIYWNIYIHIEYLFNTDSICFVVINQIVI